MIYRNLVCGATNRSAGFLDIYPCSNAIRHRLIPISESDSWTQERDDGDAYLSRQTYAVGVNAVAGDSQESHMSLPFGVGQAWPVSGYEG